MTILRHAEITKEFVVVSVLLENPPVLNQEGFEEVKMEICVGGPNDPINFVPFFLLAEQALVS
ncbi:hypothetical protein GCM10010916_38570 [Paenibacillus abyssi]|uniref:Uncharacterized protein n=1 Tax=Paenibacillus abyssi TaxID=1340531 RepID=A0A917LF13_9BACL|nr:hypothetical protein GCM10010916_38570 [Paenibacillus abyssi]